MPERNNILLIAYVFPPYPGVGGRRWAKFARELAEKGYEVNVICAENILEIQSPWTKDTNHSGIRVTRLPARYPAILEKRPKSFGEKLKYRFWTKVFTFFSKGQVFERTLFWRKQLLRTADEIIRTRNISTVIVTGPPFLLMYYASELKQMHTSISFVSDFRDPWTDNTSFMGYRDMHPRRLAFEKKIEQIVLERSDLILTVAEKMSDDIRRKIGAGSQKVMTLPNGFDVSELSGVQAGVPRTDKKFRMVYTGNVYNDLGYIFTPLAAYLALLKKTRPEIFSSLEFRFFGQVPEQLIQLLRQKQVDGAFVFSDWVSRETIGEELYSCDACLLMYTPEHGFAMNTKFFEYIAHRKPVLLFSNEGSTADFVVHNQLGYHIRPDSLAPQMDTIIKRHFDGGLQVNEQFNIDQYSISSLTSDLVKLLDDVRSR